MRGNRKLIFSIAVLVLLAVMSIAAPLIAPLDPVETQMSLRNELPSAAHWLGTDSLGRDVASRVIYGGRGALSISFAATLISMVVGVFFGSVAGWFGKWADAGVQVLMSIFQGLPGLSIAIAIVGVLGASNLSILIAMVLTGWSGVSRLVRSQVRSYKDRQFVDAARLYLPGSFYLVSRHVLPLAFPTLVVLAMNRMGRMILTISSLSFIGVGLQPPTPDWGVMVQDARQYFGVQPYALIAPALMMLLAAFFAIRLGEILRDRWDVYQNDEMQVGR
ncbi:ABC transporter permease [Propionimicrobium lymphophilum]|uniref:ABC transporter permease n=1 Tax=Propionimicrobium lymphophilum TaxID=33012 RepID=UPI003EC6A3AF